MSLFVPISVAARSKLWICGRVFAATVGLNPAVCMDVCVLWVLCVVCAVRVEVKNYERSVLWIIHEHSLDSNIFFSLAIFCLPVTSFFILFCTFCSFFDECLSTSLCYMNVSISGRCSCTLCVLFKPNRTYIFRSGKKLLWLPEQMELVHICRVICRNASNRFTGLLWNEMHKLIPLLQFTNQFSLVRAPSSRRPIVVSFASFQLSPVNESTRICRL